MHLRIATRKSALAMWQSEHVRTQLLAHDPALEIDLLPVSTAGDRIIDRPLAAIGGKGLFIKELEVAMLEGRADLAVHSMKDMPAELPDEFCIAALLPREDPRDALVSPGGLALAELGAGARVGTSSLRRQSQLLAERDDLNVASVRGNVPTRLGKLDAGEFDAIVLAYAGLKRLELIDERCAPLEPQHMLPAVGQGAIGVECRADDDRLRELLAHLNCAQTTHRVTAERALNLALGGSCEHAIAGHAVLEADTVRLSGLVASPDGREVLRASASGPPSGADDVGQEVAAALLQRGAARVLGLG